MMARFNMHRIYRIYWIWPDDLAMPQLGDEGFEARMRRLPARSPV